MTRLLARAVRWPGILLPSLGSLLLVGCLSDSGAGTLGLSGGPAHLPLEERGDLLVARMDIGEARRLPVLVDTGTAGGLVISPEAMARIDPGRKGAGGSVRRDLVWRSGGAALMGARSVVAPLPRALTGSRDDEPALAGVLGAPAFLSGPVTLSYRPASLEFGAQPAPETPRLRLRVMAGLMVVEGVLNERPVRMALDSASEFSLMLFRDRAPSFDLALHDGEEATRRAVGQGGEIELRRASARSLAIGPFGATNATVWVAPRAGLDVAGIDGLLGAPLMRCFRWTFLPAAGEIAFRPETGDCAGYAFERTNTGP